MSLGWFSAEENFGTTPATHSAVETNEIMFEVVYIDHCVFSV
jgi:hypothetical protein